MVESLDLPIQSEPAAPGLSGRFFPGRGLLNLREFFRRWFGRRRAHRKRYSFGVLVHAEHADLDFLPGLDLVGHGLHALIGKFGDVKESVDPIFQFDECSEFRGANDFAVHFGVYRVLGLGIGPGVLAELLQAERDSLLGTIHAGHAHLDHVAFLDEFGRMAYSPGPAHFADRKETVDTRFQLDKRPEIRESDDTGLERRPDGVLLLDVLPWTFGDLFQAE